MSQDDPLIPLVLASASPRRQQLLAQLANSFLVEPSGIEEDGFEKLPVGAAAVELARRKALEVSSRLLQGLVIAADTLIDLDGEALGKPLNAGAACRMLRLLRGRCHRVITGLAVFEVETGRLNASAIATEVEMKDFDDQTLDGYVAGGEPLDKAGAYAIQGEGRFLIDRLRGCYNNVVGLPLCELSRLVRPFPVALRAESGQSCRLPTGELCPRLLFSEGDEGA